MTEEEFNQAVKLKEEIKFLEKQVYTAPAATESTDKKKFTEFPEFIV
jgi:hypothetical protein